MSKGADEIRPLRGITASRDLQKPSSQEVRDVYRKCIVVESCWRRLTSLFQYYNHSPAFSQVELGQSLNTTTSFLQSDNCHCKVYVTRQWSCITSKQASSSIEVCRLLHIRFTSEYNICAPERTKRAPKRRRGENAIEWLAVNNHATFCGLNSNLPFHNISVDTVNRKP